MLGSHADCTILLIINCTSDMQVHLALLHLLMFLLAKVAGPTSCVLLVTPQMARGLYWDEWSGLVSSFWSSVQWQIKLQLYAVTLPYSLYITHPLIIIPPWLFTPPLTFCINLLWMFIHLQFTPPSPIHDKNGRTEELCNSDEREEGWNSPYHPIYSLATYWPAIHRLSNCLCGCRLVSQLVVVRKLHRVFWLHTLCAFIDNFIILCPAELSHYELHHKLHESAIAVSLAHPTARKGGV